jgi:cytochrome c553
VILEVTRQEEQYLVRQIKEMKAKTNPMNLAVNVKEYLN